MLPEETVFSVNCYISGIASMMMTLLLIAAILCRTPKEMKNYRIFLLNISVTDFLVSFSMTMLQPVPDSSQKEVERPANDSGVSYVIMGPVVYFIHPARNHLLTSLFIGLFLYSVMALPSSFFFRYVTVCHPQWIDIILQKKVMITGFLSMVLLGLTASFFMYAGDMPKSGPAALSEQVSDWSEYYAHKGDSNETRFGNLIHMNYMVYYMLYIAGIAIMSGYALLIFSATRLFTVLHQHRSTISKKTHDLQKALAMSLVCQSMLPLIFVGIPLLVIIGTVSSGIYSPIVNSIAMLIFSYQVVFSPIISFIFVRPYRKFLNPRILRDLILHPGKTLTDRKTNSDMSKIFTVISPSRVASARIVPVQSTDRERVVSFAVSL